VPRVVFEHDPEPKEVRDAVVDMTVDLERAAAAVGQRDCQVSIRLGRAAL
jgi:hypothetical protein